MTLREMFKKVAAYNELAKFTKAREVAIAFDDVSFLMPSMFQEFKTFDELRDFIRDEFVKSVADRLLAYDAWQFNKTIVIEHEEFGTRKYCVSIVEG